MLLGHETIINQLGEAPSLYQNAVTPPIYQTSNFCFGSVDELKANLDKEFEVPFYTRGNNPTVSLLRQKLAALEGTENALVFASGSAAIAAAVISQVSAGDHIASVAHPYSWSNALMSKYLTRFGIETTFVDGRHPDNFKQSVRSNTKVFYLESPNSVLFDLQDIKAVSAIARANNITTIIDNSYATPLYQRPAELGADIVVASASKYIGGHSDVVAGTLCASDKIVRRIFESEFMTLGGIPAPQTAWLLLRGLRTLAVRMKHISESTSQVISYLEGNSAVRQVLSPFSNQHSQHDLAQRQMTGSGGLFSIILGTEDTNKVKHFCDSLQHFLLACSWGGHESLIFPFCVFEDSNIPKNLVRIYVGLDNPEVLINDLEQALRQIN